MNKQTGLFDPNETFTTLCATIGLDVRLRKALSRLGYVRPTLVQSKCLPLAISSGRDLLVNARTGSGKTLAYCLPLLHKVLSSRENVSNTSSSEQGFVKAIILVPTRELCTQVSKTLDQLTYYCHDFISVATLYAGANSSSAALAQQEASLRDRPDILVSTPAGLLNQISKTQILQDTLKYSVETLVVDEADLVLSFGYANDIAQIIKFLPKICQGFLLSATLSPELDALKKIVLHSPAVLKLQEEEENFMNNNSLSNTNTGNLTQYYLMLSKKDKNLVLYVFLKLGLLKGKGLFFVNTTDGGYRLKLFLEQFHIRSAVLNAELPLRSRLNIIEQFNVGNFDYLIATDESTDASSWSKSSKEQHDNHEDDGMNIEQDTLNKNQKKRKHSKDSEYGVSRGLDFRGVSFVVNVDFPASSDSYTHRIGRTARGGAKGVALSLVESESSNQVYMLRHVQESQPPLPNITTSQTHATLSDDAATILHSSNEDSTSLINQLQPTALDFDLKEIEGFRYRVEDVSRAVTKIAVRETRAAELRAEILNNHRLQSHLADKPSDLQLLRHDRLATHVSKVQDHLKHVPKYLLPRGMQVANTNKRRKKRKVKDRTNAAGMRRTDNDPLQSYNTDIVDLDGVKESTGDDENGMASSHDYQDFFQNPVGDDGSHDGEDDMEASDINQKINIGEVYDDTGRSTSGRKSWQQKHGRGKFSKKYKGKETNFFN